MQIDLKTGETVIKIAGTTGVLDKNTVLRSISFTTNMKTHGPYGIETGDKFSSVTGNNIIVGFYARAGLLVNSIGVYVRKK